MINWLRSTIFSNRAATTEVVSNQHESDSNSSWERSLTTYLLITLQLFAISWLWLEYHIEDQYNFKVFFIHLVLGFMIHSVSPMKWRLWIYTGLCISLIFSLLPFMAALLAVGAIGTYLLILLHPIFKKYRTVLTLVISIIIAALWVLKLDSFSNAQLWLSMVGGLFMFRVILYLYNTSVGVPRKSVLQDVSYFLMLPNLLLPLFPVIPYKSFDNLYYNKASLLTYQKGIRWMTRGFFHLLLYRIIYYYIAPDAQNVSGYTDFWHYVVFNYTLVLRMSGLFHFATGTLYLFGWNLPPVFNNYFLATSFSDLWRRINIYWKDFIVKVFYYPIFFRLRKVTRKNAAPLTIIFVFLITWILHSYQWFWIKGIFPLRWTDFIYWSFFGVMIALGSTTTFKTSSKLMSIIPSHFSRGIQVTLMFISMSVLWSFWTSPSISSWLNLMSHALTSNVWNWLLTLLAITTSIFAVAFTTDIYNRLPENTLLKSSETGRTGMYHNSLILVFFIILLNPNVHRHFQFLFPKPVSHLFENRLNAKDDEQMIRGYYEDLLISGNIVQSRQPQRPADWTLFRDTDAAILTKDWRRIKIKPNSDIIFKRARFTTNSMGMRDKEYPLQKPDSTLRLGMLGGSYVVGSGLYDHEVFDDVLEKKYNSTHPTEQKLEVLNFSAPEYNLLQCLSRMDDIPARLELDGLVLITHSLKASRLIQTLRRIDQDTSNSHTFQFLTNYSLDSLIYNREYMSKNFYRLIGDCYSYFSDWCSKRNVQPMLAYWPRTVKDYEAEMNIDRLVKIAKERSFIYLDLSAVYENADMNEMRLAPWDKHPSAAAHKRVADEIYQNLIQNKEYLKWQEFKRKESTTH